ncbi:Lrp/AsnC family transcriptional regulator [Pseudomonas sp. URMO17WK12:I6]|jgi:DNA-binding Lrp family transcriptional regulator|uniref:Lrp/AsnC family transcriptional regulator n=2 Tax=unclassified Pseudomonas TaxID=196821 RepID=UPI0021139C9D|nr:Lrp/AsnC family transcriptional regulator [Pseudomonas sp. URMO17WK12:I6]
MLDQGPAGWGQSPYRVRIVKGREHMAEMDKVDRSILEILQMNGRLTNAEIAARVCLSAPACWKRLKRLEEEVIVGYHAHLNPKTIGLGLFAFISVTLDSHSEQAMEHFEAGVLALPNIIACHKVSGKYDYLLQVVVKDMEAFHELAMHRIRTLGNIKEMYTGFSLKEIKHCNTLPL